MWQEKLKELSWTMDNYPFGSLTMVFDQTKWSDSLLSFAFNLSHATFSHTNAPCLWSDISHPILDGFSWILNCTLSYMLSWHLIDNTTQYYPTFNSCFWTLGVIFVNQTALANAEQHRMTWYCACTSFSTIFMCSIIFVLFSQHLVEWKLLNSAWVHIWKVIIMLTATVFIHWDIH